MNTNEASDILEMLMDGVDPISGEILPADHVCQEPAVIRALHRAVTLLRQEQAAPQEQLKRQEKPKKKLDEKQGKLNAGRAWTLDESRQLKQLYEAGTPIQELCLLLQRRERGINRQLQYLGLVVSQEQPAAPNREPVEGEKRTNVYWTYQEDQRLWGMNRQHKSIEEMAQTLQRSEYAIFCRLERWGLSGGATEPLNQMQPSWSAEDTETLRLMCNGGINIVEIARAMGRTPDSIRARIEYMGLEQRAPL